MSQITELESIEVETPSIFTSENDMVAPSLFNLFALPRIDEIPFSLLPIPL